MNEQQFREALRFLLGSDEALDVFNDECEGAEVRTIDSFEESGLMTRNEGLVVRMMDGSEFQVQIVRSR
jgi:hypothetical protein